MPARFIRAEVFMKTKFHFIGWTAAILAVLVLLMTGCSSSGETKEEDAAAGPARTGAATFLENPSHPDGLYEVGDLAFQFLGTTWIQSAGGTPVAAGTLTGAPGAPASVAGFEDLTPEQIKALMEQSTPEDAEKAAKYLEAYFKSIDPATGVMSLKTTMLYVAGSWKTLADVDKMLNNKLLANSVPAEVKTTRAKADTSISLGYTITSESPYISLEVK